MLAPLMLAASVVLQAPAEKPTTRTVHPFKIETEYDRIRDSSSLVLVLSDAFYDQEKGLDVRLHVRHAWEGEKREPARSSDPISLQFISVAKAWKFVDHHDVVILADAMRIRDPGRFRKDVRKGHVAESISCPITFGQLKKMAGSDSVEVALGLYEFRLTDQHLAGLRDMAARLSVSSEEAEEIGADHLLLVRERRREMQVVRERRREMQEEMGRAVERAKAKAGGGRVSSDDVSAEFEATAREYKSTAAEEVELEKAYTEIERPAATQGDQ